VKMQRYTPSRAEINAHNALCDREEALVARDRQWREWWGRAAKEAGLRQSWFEQHMPPPDREIANPPAQQ
jgi:hypothetical protein